MIVGIDVSKDKIDVAILPQQTHNVFKNTEKGINKLIRELKQVDTAIKLIGLEYTGGYEKLLVKKLVAAGYSVHVAQGKRIHYFAKAQGCLGKTDKRDALIIAQYTSQDGIKSNAVTYLEDIELRELQNRYNQVENLLSKEKTRLDKGLFSKEATRSIKRLIGLLEKEKELLNEQITQMLATDEHKQETIKRLKTVKGVGEGLARTLVIFLPELGQRSRTKIASLVGVAPINNDSGKKQGYRKTVGGRGAVKRALFMGALSASRFNKTLQVYYQHLIAQGKKKKVALMAVMRKLLLMLNAMERDKVDWNDRTVATV